MRRPHKIVVADDLVELIDKEILHAEGERHKRIVSKEQAIGYHNGLVQAKYFLGELLNEYDQFPELLEHIPQWIPVEERLPDTNLAVLVGNSELIFRRIAVYRDTAWRDGDGVNLAFRVTHWQPLPPPPDSRPREPYYQHPDDPNGSLPGHYTTREDWASDNE